MSTLHTALQEGFSGDEVVLRVDGREVFHQNGVKTRLQIGLAATHDIEVADGTVAVEIALPARRMSRVLPLEITGDTYLGVSLASDGAVRHVVSHEPFGYV